MNSEQKLKQILNVNADTKQIFIKGYNINYIVAGHGSPLLLIHPANLGWGIWYPNITELSKYFKIYAIDLPGAGRSTRIDYAHLDLNKDFIEIVEQFILSLKLQNLHIIGCSIGGWLAMKLAIIHPEIVNKIVVVNSVGFTDYIGFSDKIIRFYPFAKFISKTFLRPSNKKNMEAFLRGILYNKKTDLEKEFVEYFCETMETSHNLLLISRLTALNKELNLEKELPNIKAHTLIIWGEKDKIIPLHKNINNFNLIPKVEIEIIKDTGHMPSLEKKGTFNEIVTNFLVNESQYKKT